MTLLDRTLRGATAHNSSMPEVSDEELIALADALRPALVAISHLIRRQTAQLPLTMPQSAVLGQLIDGKPKRVTEIAAAEGVQPSTMTDLLSRMETQGWISRSVLPGDRRVFELSITDRGRELLEAAIAERNEMLARRLSKLSVTELRLLRNALPALLRLGAVRPSVLDALGTIGERRRP